VLTYSISGTVSGAIPDGVLISLSGTMTATTTTAGGGLYSFSGLKNGSYTLTPSKANYSFDPAGILVTGNGSHVTGPNLPITYTMACSADTWATFPSPVFNTSNGLYGVWGTGANDVWAVGGFDDGWDYDKSNLIQHWNGTDWSTPSTGTTATLLSAWGSGASDIWVVGEA